MNRAQAYRQAGHTAALLVLGYKVGPTEPSFHSTRDAAITAACATQSQERAEPHSALTMIDSSLLHECLDLGAWGEAERLLDAHWPLVTRIATEMQAEGKLTFNDTVAGRLGLNCRRDPVVPAPRTMHDAMLDVIDQNTDALEKITTAIAHIVAPKVVIRDGAGRAVGIAEDHRANVPLMTS